MNSSFLSARATRVALFSLLALGAYTGAEACPCGCVRVPVDNLADRPAALAGAYTLDVRYDSINQDKRDNGAIPHFTARHHNVTATVETSLLGMDWYLVVPRIDRTIATASASGKAVGLGDVSVGSRFKVGDYRLIAGVKLPTGADDLALVAPRRYLQPGTGSTDVLLGVRRDYAAPAGASSFFWQLSAQAPVTYDENFRPGSSFTGTAGLKVPLAGPLALSIQGTAIRQFRDNNSMATVNASYGADKDSAAFSTHLASGLTYQVGATSSLYVYYSTVLNVVNKAGQSNGTVGNPVHGVDVLSVGFNHRF